MKKFNIVRDWGRNSGKVVAYPANHWPRLNMFEKLGEIEARNAAEAKHKYETNDATTG